MTALTFTNSPYHVSPKAKGEGEAFTVTGSRNWKPPTLVRDWRTGSLETAFKDTNLYPVNLGYPLFIQEGAHNTPIEKMPGCNFLGLRHGLVEEVAKARDVGVNIIFLLPRGPHLDGLLTPVAPDDLLLRAICLLKDKFPDLVIFTEVVLDHDILRKDEDGVVMSEETVEQLCKQAVAQAKAGADVVTPSDTMLNGWIRAIREALDVEGFEDVPIMSNCAKGVLFSCGCDRGLEGGGTDDVALLESRRVEIEGADILLVKPTMFNTGIILDLRSLSPMPIVAYQSSAEYVLIKQYVTLRKLHHDMTMLGFLGCTREAGAQITFTHFALEAAKTLSLKRGERNFALEAAKALSVKP